MVFVHEKTGKKATGELIVYPGEFGGDPDGIGVVVKPDGGVTNRWGDGTAGLNDDARDMAAEETEAYEPFTQERYVWKPAEPKKVKATTKKRKSTKRSSSKPVGMQRLR